jgi:ribosomal protein S17E
MGKIKTRLIKRTAKELVEKGIEFQENFEKNKKILGKEMPSKKVRNQIAYINNETDDGDAIVINVISAKGLYVDNDGDAFMCLTSTF